MKEFKLFVSGFRKELEVSNIVSKYFEGYSLYSLKGFWKGLSEKSIMVYIITENSDMVKTLANELKTTFKQESVLITENDIKASF